MKEMNGGNSKRLTIILVGIIAVLLLVVLYAFILRPSINGYAIKLQTDGVNYALNLILSEVQQKGYVQIPVGENQSIMLVPYIPPQNPSVSAG